MSVTSGSSIAAQAVLMIGQGYLRTADQPVGREEGTSIQEAARDLSREIEFLQDLRLDGRSTALHLRSSLERTSAVPRAAFCSKSLAHL